jgi:hypothetical protein
MSKAKIIEAEAAARWDAILQRDFKEDNTESKPELKETDEKTLGRTVPSEHN